MTSASAGISYVTPLPRLRLRSQNSNHKLREIAAEIVEIASSPE